MIPSSDQDPTDLPGGRSRSAVSWGLNTLGIVIVGSWFVRNGLQQQLPAWVYVVGAVALAGWALREFGRSQRTLVVAAAVMVLAGSVLVVPTDGLLAVPVIVGLVVLQADLRLPVWTASVAALVAIVVVAGVGVLDGRSDGFVLGAAAGVALGVLIGFSRRQFRIADAQARRSERDRQRAELLADRSRAARDVHDVLAHSLGGLVLQLDAVEALLEAGRVDEAARRAGDARALAADGLAEARRAVAALRDEPAPAPGPAAVDEPSAPDAPRASRPADEGLAGLVAAHRSFGGEAAVQGDLTLADLDAAHRDAVVAATREALSNARRHAPGRPVTLSVIRDGDAVDVVVANPLAATGHGLVGMRERFADLGDEATIEAERSEGEFVVAMHVPVADARVPGADA